MIVVILVLLVGFCVVVAEAMWLVLAAVKSEQGQPRDDVWVTLPLDDQEYFPRDVPAGWRL